MDDPNLNSEVDLRTQEILLASAHHDVPKLRALLRNTNASVQDPETGYSPLHAAIASCEVDEEDHDDVNGNHQTNGDTNGTVNGSEEHGDSKSERDKLLESAAETVRFLFQHGALWNDVDAEGESPGCMARRLGLKEIYEIIVDQGVRAELLTTRMDQYEVLLDHDGEEGEEEGEPETEGGAFTVEVEISAADEMNDAVTSAAETFIVSSNLLLSNEALLNSIWTRTAELVLPKPGLRLLTLEPSLDLLSVLQARLPSKHHIIASDPAALQQMRGKQDVIVHTGKWPALLPQLMTDDWPGDGFDAIYFGYIGPIAKYKELRTFFSEWAEQLLDAEGGDDGKGGLLTFFHDVGAERQVQYDVYTKILEMDLFEANFDTEWESIPVTQALQETGREAQREGAQWGVETYRLPICRLVE